MLVEHAVVFPDIQEIHLDDEKWEVNTPATHETEEQATVVETMDEAPISAESSAEQVYQLNIEELLENARHEGYEQGYNDARKDLEHEIERRIEAVKKNELDPLLNQLAVLFNALQHQWKQVGKKIEDAVLTLALNVAQQVIKTELSSNGMIILNQAREAIQHLAGVERLRIRVHPEDEKILKQYRSELIAASDAVKELIIEPDEHLSRGGCILESESGNVDATIETQVRKISDLLLSDHELTT